MVHTDGSVIAHVREHLGTNGPYVLVERRELEAMVWFLVYGQNVYSQVDRDWTGCTFRQGETTCLLVAKSRRQGIPEVAFCTDRNPTGCMVAFLKGWEGDTLRWYPDKYA